MLASVAGILSIAVAQAFLPAMNTLLDKAIDFDLLKSPSLLVALLLTILLTGLLAGIYPAFVIARFNPGANLKPASATIQNIGSSMLRKALIVVQFTISIGLLIAVGFIAQQVRFLRNKNLGFDKDNIINVGIGNVAMTSAFATALNQIPQVKHFSFETGSPTDGEHWGAMISLTDRNDPGRVLPSLILADDQFCTLYDLKLPEVYKEVGISIEANSDIPLAIASIERAWKTIYTGEVFEVRFLDQSIDSFYKAETRLYTLFKMFSALAMCISCLGLWGLAAFTVQHRTKEIGIRKVLGASVKAIAMLLSKDFISMVAIALALATPLVYYFITKWLQNFAYRIDVGWEVFVIAGIVSIAIALITVSAHTLKAALGNPLDSLRNE